MTERSFGSLRLAGTAAAWGALWGPVFGIWAVVPHFLRTNHVHPTSAEQWLLLAALSVAIFGAFGIAGSLFSWLLLEGWQRLRRRRLRAPGWACAFTVVLCLPPLYFFLAASVELTVFRSVVGLEGYDSYVAIAVGVYLSLAAALVLAYRGLARQEPSPPGVRVLAASGIAALLSGFALAPLWGGAIDAGNAEIPLLETEGPRTGAPVLFLGVDSATWRVATPLIERGRAPTFRRLIERGIHGEVLAAATPVWSGPAWAAIVTGYPRHENGIYQELAAVVPGLPPFQVPLGFDFLLDPLFLLEYRLATAGYVRIVPLPRNALRRPPFWERLWDAGVPAALIRFPFTYPADGRGAVVISDYAGEDAWKLVEVRADTGSGVVSPPELSDELLAAFIGPSPGAERVQSILLPGDVPPSASGTRIPPEESLRIAVQIDQRTFDVAEQVLRSGLSVPVFGVFLGGFDTVCHAFWQYRFPEDFSDDPPDEESVRELAPVIDRYFEFLDQGIARLIASYPETPNVILTADHGHAALYENRIYSGGHSVRDGLFVAAGPDIPHRNDLLEVTWFDVVPTLLEVLGIAIPEDLPGYSLLSPDARIRRKTVVSNVRTP